MTINLLSDTTSQYAVRRRKHLDLIKQLRAIGAQADLDLPRIVVIGNQSAGKSSLVEAISGINVPRDAGTCTRCPMECRMASSEKELYQVLIRWEFDHTTGETRNEVRELKFGPPMKHKAEVELMLRRAQCAVLNPGVEPAKFVGLSAEELRSHENELLFSTNTVCVDLQGPGLTDLAFVDLPGIIQNADEGTVAMVEKLVTDHIQGNCLILVTLPMSDDIENQKAAKLAEIADPCHKRTIGVLTKPDTLTIGAMKSKQMWLDVIEGRRHVLQHGYFCTKQPDDRDRMEGITPAQAREAERSFFSQTPWSDSTDQHRFGTTALVENLAMILSNLIDETLPTLQSEVSQQLASCLQNLQGLPKEITDEPSQFVTKLVTKFCADVRQHVKGDGDTPDLVQKNRVIYYRFKSAIRDSAPLFLPFVNETEMTRANVERFYFRFEEPEKSLDGVEDDADYSGVSLPTDPYVNCIFLPDVRKRIQSGMTRELPDNVPYSVKVSMIRNNQKSWQALTSTCFNEVKTAFARTLETIIQHRFSRYRLLRARIEKLVNELTKSKADAAREFILDVLSLNDDPFTQNGHYLHVNKAKYESLYKGARAGKFKARFYLRGKRRRSQKGDTRRKDKPSKRPRQAEPNGTEVHPNGQNHGAVTDMSEDEDENEEDEEQRAVTPSPVLALPKEGENSPELTKVFAALAEAGYTNVSSSDLGKLVKPDIYETELLFMAEVRAYFQVAYKRVIDNIPSSIDQIFMKRVSESMQDFLLGQLQLGTPDAAEQCRHFLAEDPLMVQRRDELTKQKNRLDGIQAELNNFGL